GMGQVVLGAGGFHVVLDERPWQSRISLGEHGSVEQAPVHHIPEPAALDHGGSRPVSRCALQRHHAGRRTERHRDTCARSQPWSLTRWRTVALFAACPVHPCYGIDPASTRSPPRGSTSGHVLLPRRAIRPPLSRWAGSTCVTRARSEASICIRR